MPPLLLEALLAAAACSAPASPTVCNTSDFPYPACQPSCAGESGGVKCVGGDGRQQRQQLPMAHGRGGSGSSSRGGCLNCTGVVCTMSVPSDTAPPETSPPGAAPGPGRRVQLTATGWGHTKVRHTLLLPEEFELARREPWPMLVELPGNGCGFGGPWPRDCGSKWTAQGWGVSQGRGAVWLTLPFVTRDLGADTAVQTGWWGCSRGGEPFTYQESCLANDTYTTNTTLAYLKAAIRDTIDRFHVDRQRIILLGHSRGAIATQAIGSADEEVAGLWRGIVAASHYDGAEHWAYSSHAGGMAGAIARAQRLSHVPKFLVGECDLESGIAADWLRNVAKVDMGKVTAVPSGFRDHTGFWILRPSAARERLRAWVKQMFEQGGWNWRQIDAYPQK